MLQTIKNNWALVVTGFALLFMVALVPSTVSAVPNIQTNVEEGTCLSVNATNCQVSTGTTKVDSTLTQVINIFSIIVGIVAVIMLIFGGFRYVTSGGDSGNIGNAKNTILYAIVGLVIVAISQAIVQFVLDKSV